MIERCLETELDMHLGYPKHGRRGNVTGNSRHGQSQKTLKGEQEHIDIEVPRDRQRTFEPQLVKQGHTRMVGTDRENPGPVCTGMTTRDIQAHLQEFYAVEVSPTLMRHCDRGRDGRGAKVGKAAPESRSLRLSLSTA